MCTIFPNGTTESGNLQELIRRVPTHERRADGQGVTIRSSHPASDKKDAILGPDRDPGSNPGRRTNLFLLFFSFYFLLFISFLILYEMDIYNDCFSSVCLFLFLFIVIFYYSSCCC